jgi:hypothetical protein
MKAAMRATFVFAFIAQQLIHGLTGSGMPAAAKFAIALEKEARERQVALWKRGNSCRCRQNGGDGESGRSA